MERKSLSKKVRFEVFKRDSFTCQYCGKAAPDVVLHIDHIQPVSKDGEDDITNLITSCFDCNMGKSDRELSDNAVIQKRKKQLDDLQERRDQLDMMVSWQRGLIDIEEQETTAAMEFVNHLWLGRKLNELGNVQVKKLVKRFGLKEFLECSRISADQYLVIGPDGHHTGESTGKMMDYIEKIAGCRKRDADKPYLKDLYYVRGIVRNRMRCIDWLAMDLLQAAYLSGITIDKLKIIALKSETWTEWRDTMEEITNGE